MKKVQIELVNGNIIKLNLYEEQAPISVANFLHLVDIHFYDGLIFHRIIKGFMSQGGAYYIKDGKLEERKLPWTIPGEFSENGFTNGMTHEAGTISMARTNNPNSGNSQFFICDADTARLDGKYAAFGYVSDKESLNVVHKLSAIETAVLAPGFENFPTSEFEQFTIKTITRM